MKLFRPVGLLELALLWDSGMKEFPPRLPSQPIFYPVAELEYARQIARDWNTRDEGSGFAGYVTEFEISESFIKQFEPRVVGSSLHKEFWIPAEQVPQMNASLSGLIATREAFFGENFKGWIPDGFGLKGRDAAAQFVAMFKTWDYSRMDFALEMSANRKLFYLNFLFWCQFDFTAMGMTEEQKRATINNLRLVWDRYPAGIPLPAQ